MLLCAIALLISGSPQTSARLDQDVADYLGHSTFTVATLELREDLPQAWNLEVPIAGRMELLTLHRRSLRSADFALLVDRGNGVIEEIDAPPVSTYRGVISGWPTAKVALTLTPSGAKGLIWDEGSSWTIEPLLGITPGAFLGQHVIAPARTSPFDDGVCGTITQPVATQANGGLELGTSGSPTCLTIADLSYDCDYECYQQFGSDVAATLADIEAVTNGVIIPFESDVFITYRLGTVLIRTTNTDPYISTDSGLMLDEFRNEWNSTQATVVRDLVHLATGKELDSNIIGLAYVGTVCPNGFEYGLTQWNISFGSRIAVVAHEAGHNWSAPHCLDSAFCGIMCGGCTLSFGPITKAQIIGFRDTRGCRETPPPVIDYLLPSNSVTVLTPGILEAVAIVGDCFTDSSDVVVDGIPLSSLVETYTVQTEGFISFEMPLVSSLGPVELRVDDPNGSASSSIIVEAPLVPVHQVGAGEEINAVYPALGADFILAGEPGDLQLLVYSMSNIPSVTGPVSLLLGNNFTDIQIAGAYTIGVAGWTGFNIPVTGVTLTSFYSQSVRVTGGAPFPASNLQTIFVAF
ncbi:MAG: hypothetical protein ACI8QS_002164 [Planctomycetota bacterium]|jgi:hypothetical protein